MKVSCKVDQIKSDLNSWGGVHAYANILDVGIAGIAFMLPNRSLPTYRATKQGFLYILQFMDTVWANEYFEENKFDFVERIDEIEWGKA